MAQLTCDGRSFDCPSGVSVLETLDAHGVRVSSGCRSGICQSCLVRLVSGAVPEAAQRGLTAALRENGYFLACSCYPVEDIGVATGHSPLRRIDAQIVGVSRYGADILSLRLQPRGKYAYVPGQFVRLYQNEDTSRCYSIASVPGLDEVIELHIKRLLRGSVSSWLHDTVCPGQSIRISEPMGQCHYAPGEADQPLLLIGTGVGLAPLFGIVRDALHREHRGPIRLYHGSRSAQGLYLVEELSNLAQQHSNFSYVPCISGDTAPSWATHGRALQRALADCPELGGWRVFICGNPAMVDSAQREAFLAGASLSEIHADPFLAS